MVYHSSLFEKYKELRGGFPLRSSVPVVTERRVEKLEKSLNQIQEYVWTWFPILQEFNLLLVHKDV